MPQRVHLDRRSPDALVLAAYERLYVGQPQVRLEGLWAVGEHYYLVCPEADRETKAVDGSPLMQWVFEPLSMMLPPIELVTEAPAGSRRVEPRGIEATVELRGITRVVRDIFIDLALALGPEFPSFSLVDTNGLLEIHVDTELQANELGALRIAAETLDEAMAITVVYPSKPADGQSFYRAKSGDVTLLPSRALSLDTPRKVRWMVEEDEAFWMSHRKDALLGDDAAAAISMFPTSWQGTELRCVVDATVFPPANIRSYLTLYETVFLGLPLGDKFEEALEQFGATPGELVDLLGTGRLKILLPQSIDRYPMGWLAEALEAGGDSIVASRRIACGVLADSRNRFPFLHPPLDLQDRRLLFAALDSAAANAELPPDVQRWFRILSNECKELWQFTPLSVQREGALQTARSGIGWLASRLHEEFTGQERILEIMGAAAVVEWAAALNAHVFPKATETYSEEAASNLLAAMYSPFGPGGVPVADPRVHGIVDGLLAIDNDIPLLEFAKGFRGADVDRFRSIVTELATWNQEDSYLQQAVERFNAEVRQCESKPNRLRTMNVTSLIAAVAAEAAPALPHALHNIQHLPVGVWLLGVLLGFANEPTPKSGVVGRLWDHTNGLLGRTSPRAVLVSRLRQRVKIAKQ
jgi:hypothetical protein